jgi:hypothetical protein
VRIIDGLSPDSCLCRRKQSGFLNECIARLVKTLTDAAIHPRVGACLKERRQRPKQLTGRRLLSGLTGHRSMPFARSSRTSVSPCLSKFVGPWLPTLRGTVEADEFRNVSHCVVWLSETPASRLVKYYIDPLRPPRLRRRIQPSGS